MHSITYQSGYKYQLCEDYEFQTDILGYDITTKYIVLNPYGELFILSGYAWDGPSGPTIDTKNFMRGSLVHDALYQLIRMELIDRSLRKKADYYLRAICREDGMSWLRSFYVWRTVRRVAGFAAIPGNTKKCITAP